MESSYEYSKKKVQHDHFETLEGIYCIACGAYYKDSMEYFCYHRDEHPKDSDVLQSTEWQ